MFPTIKKLSVLAGLLLAGFAGSSGCTKPPLEEKQPYIGVLPQGSFQRAWLVNLNLDAKLPLHDQGQDVLGDQVIRVDVQDPLVYVYLLSKRVLAYDRKAGTVKLTMHVDSAIDRLMPLQELKDFLVFPDATALHVYDKTGQFQRDVPLPVPLRSNLAGDGNTVFFGAAGPHGGLVEAYDLSLQYAPKRWDYLTRDAAAVTAAPVVSTGVVYSGSNQGEIDAVNDESRAQIWDTEHGAFYAAGPIYADLRVDDSGLYVASDDSKMYSLNRGTGKLQWQYFASAPLKDPPVLTSDTVYLKVSGKGIVALDKSLKGAYDRSPRWVYPAASQFLAQDEKNAYLLEERLSDDPSVPTERTIVAVDKQTGEKRFTSSRTDFIMFGTNPRDNLIYAVLPNGRLMAIMPVLKAGVIGELVMVPLPSQSVLRG